MSVVLILGWFRELYCIVHCIVLYHIQSYTKYFYHLKVICNCQGLSECHCESANCALQYDLAFAILFTIAGRPQSA